jgi:predicted CXXCH cytochrome family protein
MAAMISCYLKDFFLTRRRSEVRLQGRWVLLLVLLALGQILSASPAAKSDNGADLCLGCHGDKSFSTKRGSRTVSLFVDGKRFGSSVHNSFGCTGCHADLAGADIPHPAPKKVVCGTCHDDQQKLYANSVHGKAMTRGNSSAPHCVDCHGNHDILHVKDKNSAVSPLKIPYICGGCHREDSPAQRNLPVTEQNILENYTESIHGEGLLKKGLSVAANCASCHTPHNILRPNDPSSSISRKNIVATCTQCHAQIESVHRKIIKGVLWEKEASVLPACVDCHQPHKVRKEFYTQGMANADCLGCHAKEGLKSYDGRNMTVHAYEVAGSVHANIACSQCHSEVNASKLRPCETITQKVDCSKCHEAIGQDYQRSTHGQLFAKQDENAPTCKECHGTHHILNKHDPASRTYPTNVPNLCASCHREGQKAAIRYKGNDREIVSSYMESIHGKGLMMSGLTVTATCTNCHTAHRELPKSDPESTVNPNNLPGTCGACHRGIWGQFQNSVHSKTVTHTDKPLPVCNDCHSAHSIRRADQDDFKLDVMNKCGHCHEEIAKTYFDTYHGKVSKLGYTKTAKCYDCHGAHDILKVTDPNSHLSRANVVATCRKCHADATRRFAGYLTHATHHDPKKYPILFYAFWGMTSLLAGTFVIGGVHTLLWLPRAFQMRRELKAEEAQEAAEEAAHKAAEEGKNDVNR